LKNGGVWRTTPDGETTAFFQGLVGFHPSAVDWERQRRVIQIDCKVLLVKINGHFLGFYRKNQRLQMDHLFLKAHMFRKVM
jgi:hypothetical protein